MSAGAGRSWVGARCRPRVEGHLWGVIVIWSGVSSSVGGAFGVGYRHPCVGIVVRGWGIAFRAWGSLLSVGGGARHLLWFERPGGRSREWWVFVWVVGEVWGFAWCGGSCGWWGGFVWVWAFT